MAQIRIEEIYPKGNVYPYEIIFQNGYPTDNLKGNECMLLKDANIDRKTIITEINNLLYAGEEVDEELGKTLILARNKKTGKVRLIEVGNIEMQPVIKTNPEPSQQLETSTLELSRKFGSKKHKKYMEHLEKLKVNVQTVAEQMQNVTSTITEEQLDLSNYNKADLDDFYVPPINRNATNVESIYELDLILSTQEYEKIYSEIECSDYIDKIHPYLKVIVSAKMSQQHAVLAVYANSLLHLFGAVLKEIVKKSFVACTHSATLNEIILRNFISNVNNRRGRSQQLKDKSLCHALVFIMLINNYKLDIDELCKQLKLIPRAVTMKIAITGATIVTVGNKKIAQLKLPLSKPPMRRKSTKF